jgi:[ribosomal protein S18]-alanine N-acetyltransferase
MPKSTGRLGRAVAVERGRQRGTSRVREFRPDDADAVMAIPAQSPEAANWSKESYVKFAGEPGSLALVLEEADGQIGGFLLGRLAADQAELLNLAVVAKQRRQGAGTVLLAKAIQAWRPRGAKSVYLEVRQSNTGAIAFYEKHGFAKTGLRKEYYRAPDEAALTMVKKLTASMG